MKYTWAYEGNKSLRKILIILLDETLSGEIFVERNYSSGEIFVTCQKIRHFRPTKFRPIRYVFTIYIIYQTFYFYILHFSLTYSSTLHWSLTYFNMLQWSLYSYTLHWSLAYSTCRTLVKGLFNTSLPWTGLFHTPLPCADLFTYSYTLPWSLSYSSTLCWSLYLLLYLSLVSFLLLYLVLVSYLLLYLTGLPLWLGLSSKEKRTIFNNKKGQTGHFCHRKKDK